MTTYVSGTNSTEGLVTAAPVFIETGTSFTYNVSQLGMTLVRSNATVAMTDTLPVLTQANSANGWTLWIYNTDASAAITLSPVAPALIDGASSKSLAAATRTRVIWDGTNFWA
jgi:hypothetical protein